MLTAAHRNRAVGVVDRGTDRRDAGLALLDALDPAVGAGPTRQHAAGRARLEREQHALGDDPAQACGDWSDTTQRRCAPSRTKSCTLSPVSSRRRSSTGRGQRGEREPVRGNPPQRRELGAEVESALLVAPQQPVLLQRHGEPVRGRPRQPGRRLQPVQCARPVRHRAQHVDRFVEHADARYDVHTARSVSQKVGRT